MRRTDLFLDLDVLPLETNLSNRRRPHRQRTILFLPTLHLGSSKKTQAAQFYQDVPSEISNLFSRIR